MTIIGKSKNARRRRAFWQKWIETHGFVCYYCKDSIRVDVLEHHPKRATIDHVIPLSRGGKNDLNNKVGSCLECNQAKGNIRHY